MLDLIVTLPHLFAVLVVVGWLLHARRTRQDHPGDGGDGSGGTPKPQQNPQGPLIGGRRGDDLARSA
jgi:hypothetical protein